MAQKMTAAQDAYIQQVIQTSSIERWQSIYSATVTPANNPVINITPQNVGLVKYFLIKCTATVANNDGANAITPSDFGPCNLFSNITYNDYLNNPRVNTSGQLLHLLNTCRHQGPYASAFKNTAYDSPLNYGSNWLVQGATSSIAHGATGTVEFYYVLPLAYSDTNYKGAVWAQVVNANSRISLTFNSQPGVATGSDSTFAMYVGSTSVAVTSATINIYQVYMDQLPQVNGQYVVPLVSLSYSYDIKQTSFGAMTQGLEFPMAYANFRTFLSSITIFNNGTNTNGGRGVGTDVDYWALQTASNAYVWKYDPYTSSLRTRGLIGTDLPPGTYYHSHRDRPVDTQQYGNQQLIVKPLTIGGAQAPYILQGTEAFQALEVATLSGSIAGN
jgi:hypothetical protein